MDTFVARSPNYHYNNSHHHQITPPSARSRTKPISIPSASARCNYLLPPSIEFQSRNLRQAPVTIKEYEKILRNTATDAELLDRVFFGGIASNKLRAALWPYLFGLVEHRGRFVKNESGVERYIDHEGNSARWSDLRKLYFVYKKQWKSFLPDQELRFSAFRERKSLIERDVVRCDRLHPFYADKPRNLEMLTELLITYMMYDFDIGYVQGMSDLAAPILYMCDGDLVRSFWIFVEVMKLFRRNFELTQKTIHFQLSCLYELVKNTDPFFAQYLEENESSNCFFAFRAIVCQFKRELMKDDEDDYGNVLTLWDTIWAVKRRSIVQDDQQQQFQPSSNNNNNNNINNHNNYPQNDMNQSDSPRYALTETELFVLSLCLAMLRRERDFIVGNRLDATDIHLHFINPKLGSDLSGFIESATSIYAFLKNDFDLRKLTSPSKLSLPTNALPESTIGSESYDWLSDFLIINGTSGS